VVLDFAADVEDSHGEFKLGEEVWEGNGNGAAGDAFGDGLRAWIGH
jgi:hypothetical protein